MSEVPSLTIYDCYSEARRLFAQIKRLSSEILLQEMKKKAYFQFPSNPVQLRLGAAQMLGTKPPW